MEGIVYNVTVKVDTHIAHEWLDWMLNVHIPEVMQTGCFTRYQFLKLLDQDENDEPTYVVQYYAASIEKYQQYLSNHVPSLRKEIVKKWGDQIVSFRTVMEVLN
jgi:hypothetical protein